MTKQSGSLDAEFTLHCTTCVSEQPQLIFSILLHMSHGLAELGNSIYLSTNKLDFASLKKQM